MIEVESRLAVARSYREGKREDGRDCDKDPCDRTVLYLTAVVVTQIFTGGKLAWN